MTTLAEIEAAVRQLTLEDRQKLLRIVAQSVGGEVLDLPEPRDFPLEEMQRWIAEDEEGMRRFKKGSSASATR
jgi:hypothetical protein